MRQHGHDVRIRRSILGSLLPLDEFDLVICEMPHDAEVLTVPTSARNGSTAYELYFEGRLTDRQHERLRRREAALFQTVDALAFWWETYEGTRSIAMASAVGISSR